MGGGLLQLVAYGAQDVYLTGNPQITFFKVVYRRHTNFSMESIQQTFNGNVGFDKTVTAQISRNGDLVHKMYLEVDMDIINGNNIDSYDLLGEDYDRYVNYVGLRLLESVTLEIGGQQIDKQYSDWMYIWNELSLSSGKRTGWDIMVGADSDMTSFSQSKPRLYVPLEFWFCRNVGLALPLIALQYHEVKVNIKFAPLSKCTYKGKAYTRNGNCETNPSFNASLWVDYIFLDTDERRRFAQMSHEYLIEQVQFTGTEQISNPMSTEKLKLNFNHPVKELIWYVQKTEDIYLDHQWYNFTTEESYNVNDPENMTIDTSNVLLTQNVYGITPKGDNMVSSALLQLNGNDRFSVRDGDYFSLVQPYQHHTNVPSNKGINVYSFGLKPEEHQPSGTLNMSRIDTAVLSIKSKAHGNATVYATNYNVLRILSGMGGLAYSN